MRKIFLLTMVLALMAAAPAMARKNPPPPPFPVIGTETLKNKIDAGENLVLIDARTEAEYAHSRLPGAINVPPEKVQFIAGFLPRDKKTLLVFYCRGYGWDLSNNAAVAASWAGYKNILLYKSGYPEWRKLGLSMDKGAPAVKALEKK